MGENLNLNCESPESLIYKKITVKFITTQQVINIPRTNDLDALATIFGLFKEVPIVLVERTSPNVIKKCMGPRTRIHAVEMKFTKVSGEQFRARDFYLNVAFECVSCRVRLKDSASILAHVRFRNWILRCASCSMIFRNVDNATNHLADHGFMSRCYKCDFCNKFYKRRRLLNLHIDEEHNYLDDSSESTDYSF